MLPSRHITFSRRKQRVSAARNELLLVECVPRRQIERLTFVCTPIPGATGHTVLLNPSGNEIWCRSSKWMMTPDGPAYIREGRDWDMQPERAGRRMTAA